MIFMFGNYQLVEVGIKKCWSALPILVNCDLFIELWLMIILLFIRKYGLDDNTVDFIGHALALHRDDRYLDKPALDTVKRMKVPNCFCF